MKKKYTTVFKSSDPQYLKVYDKDVPEYFAIYKYNAGTYEVMATGEGLWSKSVKDINIFIKNPNMGLAWVRYDDIFLARI